MVRKVIITIAVLLFTAAVVGGAAQLSTSGSAWPVMGLYVPGGYTFWGTAHAASAKVLLALAVFHLMYQLDRRLERRRKRSETMGGMGAAPLSDGSKEA
jgi:hypothetical protein